MGSEENEKDTWVELTEITEGQQGKLFGLKLKSNRGVP